VILQISRQSLLKTLQLIDKHIPSKTSRIEEQYIRIEVDYYNLVISTTGSIKYTGIFTSEEIPFQSDSNGYFCIHIKNFFRILHTSDSEIITIKPSEEIIEIVLRDSVYQFNNIVDFKYEKDELTKICVINKQDLIDSFLHCKSIIAGNTIELNELIHFKISQNKCTIENTNKRNIIFNQFDCINLYEDIDITINSDSLNLTDLFNSFEKEIFVYNSENYLAFKSEDKQVSCIKQDKYFPATEQLIQIFNNIKHTIILNKKVFLQAIERGLILRSNNKDVQFGKLTILQDRIILETQTQEYGNTKEIIKTKNDIEDKHELFFNLMQVKSIIRTLATENIQLSFINAQQPLYILEYPKTQITNINITAQARG